MSQAAKTPPYGNWKVLNPRGDLMFRSEEKRAQWYLKRNLAKIVSENVIQLLFEPNGHGHVGDHYYLNEKHNRCVVCGGIEDLTKHHVIPRCYRRYFPDKIKSHTSYDVMPLCIPCHERYEESAFRLKQKIAVEYGMPVGGSAQCVDEKLWKVRKAAGALDRSSHTMPPERKEELLQLLREHYGKQDLTDEEIKVAAGVDHRLPYTHVYHGEYVISKTDGFVARWRSHFVQTMNPQFLPDGWTLDRSIWKRD